MAAHVDNSFMRTRPGFFTALVFRNILFNSEAFLNCPPTLSKFQFSTFDEWTEYTDNIRLHFQGRPVSFFCNPSALGQPISERTIDKASHFWEVSLACEWPEDWPLKFAEMYDLLSRIKDDLRLPGCGPLGLYLLCADMVRYGMVERPSLDEMADVIFNLRKGALSGLELLGYITRGNGPEGCTRDVVRQGLEDFSLDLRLSCAAKGLGHLQLDFIDFEHILCKFSRMWGLRFYRDVWSQ